MYLGKQNLSDKGRRYCGLKKSVRKKRPSSPWYFGLCPMSNIGVCPFNSKSKL